MPYFDAHLHVMPDEVFLNAQSKGVHTFFVNATSQDDWQQVLDISHRIVGAYACIGIHPWYAETASVDWEYQMRNLLKADKGIMVGEIGLDGLKPDMQRQMDLFRRQLALADEFNRPAHIHCVKAWDEMLEILGEYKGVQLLMHRFSGDEVLVQKLRFQNAYFSVMNDRLIPIIPDNRLLVETDSPDGLHTPEVIPDLVKQLKLSEDYLWQNLELFLDGR